MRTGRIAMLAASAMLVSALLSFVHVNAESDLTTESLCLEVASTFADSATCSNSPKGDTCDPPCCSHGQSAGCPANQHRNRCCVCVCDAIDSGGNCVEKKPEPVLPYVPQEVRYDMSGK